MGQRFRWFASTCALFLAGAALPRSAAAGVTYDWVTFQTSSPYCADSSDFGSAWLPPNARSHSISHNGTLFMLGCDEAYTFNAHVYEYFSVGWWSGAFQDVGGGYLQHISALPNGHAWGVASPDSGGFIYFWNGSYWRRAAQPKLDDSRVGVGIAAVSDSVAFLVDGGAGDSCWGGYCVWVTNDSGQSWTSWQTDWDGAVGAVDIAYDSTTGLPWLLDNRGHVWAVASDDYHGSWVYDVGTTGLPWNGSGGGAARVAAYGGQPWVIADVGSYAGGPVYNLTGNQWVQVGSVTNATDISVADGQAWIVTANGDRGNNVMYSQLVPR